MWSTQSKAQENINDAKGTKNSKGSFLDGFLTKNITISLLDNVDMGTDHSICSAILPIPTTHGPPGSRPNLLTFAYTPWKKVFRQLRECDLSGLDYIHHAVRLMEDLKITKPRKVAKNSLWWTRDLENLAKIRNRKRREFLDTDPDDEMLF
eukprot:TRINITY_DN794_c0_g1_i3.p1 TRINITY_DN794_c0_g1~~TRINITY_DN794_c0_g1_i3.p1  ORF type:complete len:151 (+),score=10.73 TRINITY_DN794_c0_g1_i3:732-1184(+)